MPFEHAGALLELRIEPTTIVIYRGQKLVAQHPQIRDIREVEVQTVYGQHLRKVDLKMAIPWASQSFILCRSGDQQFARNEGSTLRCAVERGPSGFTSFENKLAAMGI